MNAWNTFFRPQTQQPDCPQPFGCKQAWWIIAATNPQEVAQALHLQNLQPCEWAAGIRPDPKVFVSPPVRGWTFVIGEVIQVDDHQSLGSQITSILQPLSRDFGIAHYFCTHRVVEYHVWARAEQGTLVRGYAYWGEGGETLWNEGDAITEAELGLAFFGETSPEANQPGYWERTDLRFPDEECVMQMARHWCLAPVDLTPDASPPAIGLRGEIHFL